MSDLPHGASPGELLEEFCRAYERRDIERVMACFVESDDCLVLGTGEADRRWGLEDIRDFFVSEWGAVESCSLSPQNIHSCLRGTVAWLAADIRVRARLRGRSMQCWARLTGVAEHQGIRWGWSHVHISIPADVQ